MRELTGRLRDSRAIYPDSPAGVGAAHPILGPCNGYEYALVTAEHPIRHADPIREIREAYRKR